MDGGRTVAVAAVANKGKDYTEDDIKALTSLVNKMWELLRRKKGEESLHRAHDELERRVEERTADLERANEALQLSEENLRFPTSQILSAQEKERKRISYELHDGWGSP